MDTRVQVRPATPDEAQHWHAAWQARIKDWYHRYGVPGMGQRRLSNWTDAPGEVLTLLVDGTPAGSLALAQRDDGLIIVDIWVDPAHRGTGVGRAARTHAELVARDRSQKAVTTITTDDPAAAALFVGYPLRAQRMVKRLTPPPPTRSGPGWSARPMRADEYPQWLVTEIEGYAADVSDSGLATLDEARIRAMAEYAELLPDAMATPGYTWWVVQAGEDAVSSIWVAHNQDGRLSFVYGVETAEAHRGHGYGRTAMLIGEAAALAAGDEHLGLNVFGHNTVAMRLYDSLGYAVVERNRSITP